MTELARLFLVQLAAVIGIAGAIVVVVALVGSGGNDDITAAAPPSPTATTPSPSSAATDATAGSSESATSDGSTPGPSSDDASSGGTGTTSAPAAGGGLPVKVDVLNQSAGTGAADDVADRLRDAGWKVGRVDDFRGNVSTTTVYWLDPEQRRQARQVSRFLGGVRVQEGFDTLVEGRVSVVLVGR